ncbi:MAG: hypothetical protein QXL77_03125 [Candidatus Bathyarchaeia archaeon]
MNPVFDHILAMVVVSALFISAVVIMPQINMGNIAAVEQQQLRNMALNLLNAMLLDTGDPVNWGSIVNGTYYFHPNVVKRFGLAYDRTQTLYVLDPDKIQRLNTQNPLGYLPYEYLKKILNLQGYGFSFRLIPPFNVTNVDGTRITETRTPLRFVNSTALMYAIKVIHLDGSPIPNALVEGFIFYSKDKNFYIGPTSPAVTNASGICSQVIKLSLASPDYVMVILRISVADVAAILVTMGKDASVYVADINIVKDTVVLTKAKNPSNEDVKIVSIYVYTTNGEIIWLYNGTKDDHFNTGESGKHALWSKNFPNLRDLSPAILIFDFSAVEKGRREIVVAGPFKNLLNYNVFEYGGKVPVGGGAVKLQRNIIVEGMIYTAELWLWKE